jgi:transposase
MGFQTILGFDLGKFKSVCCAMDVVTRAHAFESLATTPEALRDWLARRAADAGEPSAVLLVIEACDSAGWVHDLAVALGVTVTVVNANDERWRWRRVKRKTDRDDALKLARMALLDQLPTPGVHMPAGPQRQKRRLILHRRAVVTRRTQCRNAIRSIYSQQGLPLARGNKQWTRAGVKQLKEDARDIADCAVDDLWRGRLCVELELMASADAQLKLLDDRLDALADERTTLLQSIKGVGPRLAEAVVLHLDDPHRFKRGDQVASYAGLVPKQLQSGQMSRLGHITRRGPALLRSLLVESAWVVWRHNAWAQALVEKVSRGGRGRRKLAIVALARKLLILLWGMLKTNTPFCAKKMGLLATSTATATT